MGIAANKFVCKGSVFSNKIPNKKSDYFKNTTISWFSRKTPLFPRKTRKTAINAPCGLHFVEVINYTNPTGKCALRCPVSLYGHFSNTIAVAVADGCR
jgi:hypothetical protein